MCEYVANIVYALVIRHFSKLALSIFVFMTAFLTIDIAMNIDVFGLLEKRAYAANTLIGGWSITPDQLYIGISRLLYPFFIGFLLSLIGKYIKINNGFFWCSLIITVIFFMSRLC